MKADALRTWFHERVATHEFSGVALVWLDGAPLFEYAGGIAHRGHQVPITNESRFGVASVTKIVTAPTALRLVAVDRHRAVRLPGLVDDGLAPCSCWHNDRRSSATRRRCSTSRRNSGSRIRATWRRRRAEDGRREPRTPL
jgi:hypothetical protein